MTADERLVDDLTKEFLAERQEGLERMEFCDTGVRWSVQNAAWIKGAPGHAVAEAIATGSEPVVWSPRSRQDGRTGMRALIVDDSRFIRQHLRQLLESIGLNCEEAVDENH